ncbi:MAG TPA: ParB/RepB/Spo0J family partition protein [Baekduia sp.]|nr:ParB/RepB/Spo0J family partition protein [Baekduia sp.]
MASPSRGMGRGLAAILTTTAPEDAEDRPELRDLPVELVRPNPGQPRKRFDQDALDALAASIGERGVLQPVLVRPVPGGTYELVAGERRWRAAQLAGLDRVPAIVQDRDDTATLEAALVENMAREDLNPVEEARAVAALVEDLGLTREEVGRRVGRSRVAVSNLLRLLDLPDEVLDALEDGRLTEGHGRALLLADDHADRRRLARAAAEGGWSVRVLEDQARGANAARAHAGGAPGRSVPRVHPDQEAAADEIAAALGGALGTDLRVKPRGTGYRVELTFASAEEAVDLARRLRTA